MKKYLLLTAALTLVGSATTAQAGCSDNNLQVTRLNPTELSGYQKCWLQEHRPDEPSGVVGNLFYFETVKGEYFSTTVESIVRMKPDAAAEYVTAQVVSATMDQVEEIMNEDGTVAEAEELQNAVLDIEEKIESEIVRADKLVRQQHHLEETIDLLESAAREDIEAIQVIKEQVAANEQTIASLEKYVDQLSTAKHIGTVEEIMTDAEKKALEQSLATLEADNAELTTELKTARDALLTLINANIADRKTLRTKHRVQLEKIETQRDDAAKVNNALEEEKKVREAEFVSLTNNLKQVNFELDRLKQRHERTLKKLEKTIETLQNDVKGLDMDVEDARKLENELLKKLAASREARNDNAKALRAKNEKIEAFLNDQNFTWNMTQEQIEDVADVQTSAKGTQHWLSKSVKEIAERKKTMQDTDTFGDFGSMYGEYLQLYAELEDDKGYSVQGDNFGRMIQESWTKQRDIDLTIKAGASVILGNDKPISVSLDPNTDQSDKITMALIEVSVKEAVKNTVEKAVAEVEAAYKQGYNDGHAAGYEEGYRDGYVAASQDFGKAADDHFSEDGGQ